MSSQRKQRNRVSNKVLHLHNQAERARKLASECGSPLIAELLEMHAQLCETNSSQAKTSHPMKRK
jgi:hypothetical protein